MKDLRPALVDFILADNGIVAVVGSRVFPLKIPQSVDQTSIVYTRVSGLSGHHMAGRDGLARARIQVDCWSKSADASSSLANLVKDRLDGYRGVMGAGPTAVDVQGLFFSDERESFDDTVKMYNTGRDYSINFVEL